MPIRTALWKVTAQPEQLTEAILPSEKLLEDMIVAQPQLLSDAWMLIGRQERTGFGGVIDLLAIAPDGALILIELKRARTPRDVVAQAVDYASWVEELRSEDIAAIYRRFKPNQSLSDDFRIRFGLALDEKTLNDSHQIVIVASQLDDSTERIVGYPKFRLSAQEQEELLADYLPYTRAVRIPTPPPTVPACRDPLDLPFMHLAVAGRAQVLVSGDRDLLALAGEFEQAFSCPIVSLDTFARAHLAG